MIFINVSFIKSHNGLWFYSLNLIDSFVTRFGSSVIVVCNKSQYDLLSNNYDNVLILNFSTIFRYLSDSSNIFISTNMRPFLLPRSYFIIHDFWPLRQNNFIKKSISHLIFKIGMIFSTPIFISKSHAKLLKDSLVFPNLPFKLQTQQKNIKLYNSIIIVGTETERKNLHNLNKFLDCNPKFNSYSICIFGTIDPNLNVKYKFFNSESLSNYSFDKSCIYLSLSVEEGFNRGAYIAHKEELPLYLSSIPVHYEFFPFSNFVNIHSHNFLISYSEQINNYVSASFDIDNYLTHLKEVFFEEFL